MESGYKWGDSYWVEMQPGSLIGKKERLDVEPWRAHSFDPVLEWLSYSTRLDWIAVINSLKILVNRM